MCDDLNENVYIDLLQRVKLFARFVEGLSLLDLLHRDDVLIFFTCFLFLKEALVNDTLAHAHNLL